MLQNCGLPENFSIFPGFRPPVRNTGDAPGLPRRPDRKAGESTIAALSILFFDYFSVDVNDKG
ncbi:hypothetical protein DSCA_24790 [Desulfosarcina alkanivorans]|uniref:Uncharacterized protein n=1 Tax=Desulfosarcina alkanivorans TaxID=571177 RepID=A0A5K7YKY8_9BACT|nr:hypothetical protein DSCA_24790 [Desulfosarcina alkanivorans]